MEAYAFRELVAHLQWRKENVRRQEVLVFGWWLFFWGWFFDGFVFFFVFWLFFNGRGDLRLFGWFVLGCLGLICFLFHLMFMFFCWSKASEVLFACFAGFESRS